MAGGVDPTLSCFPPFYVRTFVRTYVRTYVRTVLQIRSVIHTSTTTTTTTTTTTKSPTRKIFGGAKNFRKTRSGRRDRFRQKIAKIGAILAIFESCPAWNTKNVLLGTQEMSCLGQHRSQKYNIARDHGIMGLKKSSSKNDEF